MTLRRCAPLAILLATIPLGGADCPLLSLVFPPMEDGGVDPPDSCVDGSFSVDTAVDLELGIATTGLLCPVRDVDWWRFEVDTPGTLVRIHLSMATNLTPVEPGYTLVTGDDVPTGISGRHEGRTPGEAVDFEGLHRIDQAGAYILKVADVEGFDDRFDDTNEYTLSVELLPDPDPNEPNDTPATATPITLDTAVSALIGTTGDDDWYAVPVEADAQLLDVQVRADVALGLDLEVDIVAPDLIEVLDVFPLVDTGVELAATTRVGASGAPGDVFYVHVYETSGNLANLDPVTGTYEVVVALTADPDPNEVNGGNDTVDTATDLAPDVTVTANLSAAGDQDVYEVTVPGNASPSNPYVLRVEMTFTGGVPDEVQPQLRVTTTNPNSPNGQLPGCGGDCLFCLPLTAGGAPSACGEDYYQRVLTTDLGHVGAFPLRRPRPVYITVNDFGDDGYMLEGSYTLRYEVVPDPDPGEGDDYLIPNLQTATYDNEDELRNQYQRSRENARSINVAFEPACEPPMYALVDGGVEIAPEPDPCADAGVPGPLDGGTPGGADGGACVPPPPPMCQAVVPVPSPVGAPMEPLTVECNGQDWTVTARGRLTYEGDRDFFTFNVPDLGYWGLDVSYDVSAATPVELTAFVHDSEKLVGAWLEATETQGDCVTSTDCPVGSVCIDEKCWADLDTNPAFTGHVFPGPDQCLYVHTNFTQRPLFLEVTDNGINDFDLDMSYELRVRIRCGCPSACNGTGLGSQCQGVAPPL